MTAPISGGLRTPYPDFGGFNFGGTDAPISAGKEQDWLAMAMVTYKNRLPVSLLVGYISPAPHKAGAGFRSLQSKIAHNRASGFF
ncbi:TPA: hypothetical protein ACIVM6_004775, partial [Salmonella enterica subsp. salamae serovar 21:z10:z6]